MADNINITPGQGDVLAADDIGSVKYQRTKQTFGADGTATDVSATNPLPVQEPTFSAAISEGGVDIALTSGVVKTATAGRKYIEISNSGAAGVFIHFGASPAVVNQGSYLPSKSTNRWPYSGEVRAISETGTNRVTYVEW